MDDIDYREYCIRMIVNTSAEYAKRYIKQADIGMLEEALRRIEGRAASKTLRKLIESSLRRLKREADA